MNTRMKIGIALGAAALVGGCNTDDGPIVSVNAFAQMPNKENFVTCSITQQHDNAPLQTKITVTRDYGVFGPPIENTFTKQMKFDSGIFVEHIAEGVNDDAGKPQTGFTKAAILCGRGRLDNFDIDAARRELEAGTGKDLAVITITLNNNNLPIGVPFTGTAVLDMPNVPDVASSTVNLSICRKTPAP